MENYILQLQRHEPVLAIMATLVAVILIGTAAQIFAERLRIPATGTLLFAGLIFGSAGLGFIQPDILLLSIVLSARRRKTLCHRIAYCSKNESRVL